MGTTAPAVVAVFNTSEDTTDLLRLAFEKEGFVVVTAFTNAFRDGRLDFDSFMRQHRPAVIVYDIAIPYDANWRLFEHMRRSPAMAGTAFVLTTTNERHVRAVAGMEPAMHEIVGKPYDLELLVGVVRDALKPRS